MNLFVRLWGDDAGNVALEYLGLLTIVGLGLFCAYLQVESALLTEYTELGNAILGLSQAYTINTQSVCKGCKQGSNVTDTAGFITWTQFSVTATSIDVTACPPVQ
jgi:Flp pilus assembly pilin Flp